MSDPTVAERIETFRMRVQLAVDHYPHMAKFMGDVTALADRVEELKVEVARLSARNGRLMAENVARCTERRVEMEAVAAERDDYLGYAAVLQMELPRADGSEWTAEAAVDHVRENASLVRLVGEGLLDDSAAGLPGDGGGDRP